MKDSPTLKFAVKLWLASLGVSGFPAALLAFIAVAVLGSLLDKGIVDIDVKLDKIREAMKDPKWRAEATKLWGKSLAKVYTEKEKDEIRKDYLRALGEYASIADRLR